MPTRALGLTYVQSTILLIVVGAGMLVLLVAASFRLTSETANRAEAIASERLVRIAARQTHMGLLRAESGQRGYLFTGEEAYLPPYYDGLEEARTGLADLVARGVDPADAARIAKIMAIVEPKLAEMAETVALAKSGKREEALRVVATDRGLKYMAELRKELEQITTRADTVVGSGLFELAQSAHRLSITTALGSGLLVLLAVLAFYIVANNTGKLVSAQESLRQMTNDLEERVNDRTLALTQANEEIQRFAYIVSHDLRAPLVNIMGFTSELESASAQLGEYFKNDNATEAEKAKAAEVATTDIPESVGFIRSSSTKMDSLIGAILKLSREGRRELKRERVQLSDVMTATLASLQHQIDEAGAAVDVPDTLPSVVSDRLAIEQIVGNILDNAVKYLAPNRPGRITVSAEESGGRVKLRIADNGRGIEEADLKRIFELFRRAGRLDRPGEGIGLAHVRSLVRMMGGDVTVQSKPGEGTTFVVDLPKKMAIQNAKEQTA
ncbi:MAG: CHASE3 domain-containing protein [Hyphomicrobium sp.]|nr:CHASE3 domain-containing protein [Hyphomicrobium sp.]